MDIQAKRIIVTGSASGIGASAVKAFVAAGAQVVGLDVADTAGHSLALAATQTEGRPGFLKNPQEQA